MGRSSTRSTKPRTPAASPRTSLPDPRATPRFAGIATFCRYPRLEDVARESRPVDWALYGVPFDSGVTYRPGARFAPRAIRAESQYVKPYHVVYDLMLTDILSLADAGGGSVHDNSTVMFNAVSGAFLGDFFTYPNGGGGADGSAIYITVKPIPAPGGLAALGLIGLAGVRRRRR